MTKTILMTISFVIISASSQARDAHELSLNQMENLTDVVFNALEKNGEFAHVDDVTVQYAKILVEDIANNPQRLREFHNGELVLNEEFVTDYFLKDTFHKIGSTIKDIGTSAIKGIKDIAGGIAALANKALTAVTSSEMVMKFISTITGVVNKLLPFGASALGAALLAVPGGEVLIPVVASVTPVLMKVVTPDNVTEALKIAAATAKVADTFINQAKDDKILKTNLAPTANLLALEKSAHKASKHDREIAGDAYKHGMKGYEALSKYVKKLGKKGWEKLNKKDKEKITAALNKAAAILPLIDVEKLK